MRLIKHVTAMVTLLLVASCSSVDEPKLNNSTNNADKNFISIEQALTNADSEFQAMFRTTRSGRAVTEIETLNRHTRSEDADSLYGFYLVNYEDGFALLSADARRPEVLAISDEGSMHLSDTISNKTLATYLSTIVNADSKDFIQDGPVVNDSIVNIVPIDTTATLKVRTLISGIRRSLIVV
jgi:hypothetical protein